MSISNPLTHLGGISAQSFLRDYWQKKPLLIRNAFPNFVAPLTKKEVFMLAEREEAESRIFTRDGSRWQVEHGPFAPRAIREIRQRPSNIKWTLLIQDTQHFSYEAHDLLKNFDFIGQARIDDLMVSYAVPGGGVGAHVDSYDVFLLQGIGQRRWQISTQADLSLKPNHPVKVLNNFQPEQEWVLSTGDMLYLPPNVAHHGVAVDECMTWSIGFRAPSQQEIATAYFGHLADFGADVQLTTQYGDASLRVQREAAAIRKPMQAKFQDMVKQSLAAAAEPAKVSAFIGCYLTAPKAHVFFDPPEDDHSASIFSKRARRLGLHLDLRSRALYDEQFLYLNGERIALSSDAFKVLANERRVSGQSLEGNDRTVWAALFAAYNSGYLHLGDRT